MCQFQFQVYSDCGHTYSFDLLSHCDTFAWFSPSAPRKSNTNYDLSAQEGQTLCAHCYDAGINDIVNDYELRDLAITTCMPHRTSEFKKVLSRMQLRTQSIDDLRSFDEEVSSDRERIEWVLCGLLEYPSRRFRPSWKMVWDLGQEQFPPTEIEEEDSTDIDWKWQIASLKLDRETGGLERQFEIIRAPLANQSIRCPRWFERTIIEEEKTYIAMLFAPSHRWIYSTYMKVISHKPSVHCN